MDANVIARAARAAPAVHAAEAAAPPKRPRGRPRKTLDERDDGNRRQALLKASAKLFRRKGFGATTTRDIAAATGMQSGSPFYHFASKGELLFAVMEEGMHTALARQASVLAECAAHGAGPGERLRRLIRTHFDTLHGRGRDFIPVMLYESRSLNRHQRARIAMLQREYEAVWRPVLDALAQAGALHGDVHLARLLIFGALNWSAQWFDAKQSASLDELTDAAMALFIHAG